MWFHGGDGRVDVYDDAKSGFLRGVDAKGAFIYP